jgi:hypothetical protein
MLCGGSYEQRSYTIVLHMFSFLIMMHVGCNTLFCDLIESYHYKLRTCSIIWMYLCAQRVSTRCRLRLCGRYEGSSR